tara:strand:+ start:64739 stop:65554 length:816 start_codon:yes stop_codon:yes gene_type:complete
MRKNNSFKREHTVLGNITDSALAKGVVVRPYTTGVLLHVVKNFSGVTATIDGEQYSCCYPSVLKLMKDLEPRLQYGKYLFLWHSQARDGATKASITAKNALLGKTSQAGFVLCPLKKDDLVYQTLDDMELEEWLPGESKKMKLLRWNKVAGPNDFKRQLKNIYGRGYTSAVVRVGKKVYRLSKVEEDHLEVVGFLDSKRWGEVGGILVKVPEFRQPVEVKRGIERHDLRDMYNSPEMYLGTTAIIQHEGFTTTSNLRNSKVRALRVTCSSE